MTKCLITGGCGFLGHHMVEHLLKNTDWEIVIIDKLSYASFGLDRLRDIKVWPDNTDRVRVFATSLEEPIEPGLREEIGAVDYIIHLAAESDVDRSIRVPVPFVLNNVKATLNMLEYAREVKPRMFVQMNTDEVYGPAPDGFAFPEQYYHRPSNPYSASKSAQGALSIAWNVTYGVPAVNVFSMNLVGERQEKNKYVPLVMNKVLQGETLSIHADPTRTRAGSRFYIHCRNFSDALLHIINRGYSGYDEWNIAGLEEVDNLTLARFIAGIIGKPLKYELVDFHSGRKGHDMRYALDSAKLIASGYQYPRSLWESLETTIRWTMDNPRWLSAMKE